MNRRQIVAIASRGIAFSPWLKTLASVATAKPFDKGILEKLRSPVEPIKTRLWKNRP